MRVIAIFCTLVAFEYYTNAQRIAVIGGGISGSFVTKYLSDLDKNCTLSAITIFEPLPLNGPISVNQSANDNEQFSRVQSIRLNDGTIVEIGASIAYKDFHLVTEMIRNDHSLRLARPFSTGNDDDMSHPAIRHGMGIYSGNGDWKLMLTSSSGWVKKLQMLWRYGWDLYLVAKACDDSLASFAKIPGLLESSGADTYFASPDELWSKIGLGNAIHHSFEQLLDALGVSKEVSYLRSFFFYQGNLRRELLDAINLVNYNQDNREVNSMVGLGSFAASSGGLFSIEGGNSKLIASALQQAKLIAQTRCPGKSVIEIKTTRVTAVVAGSEGFELFSNDESLGSYDIVILAAPLHMARVEFFTQSHFDPAVLQSMTFGRKVDPFIDDLNVHGYALPPGGLPEFATRPYTQVTTTVVSSGNLSGELLNIKDEEMPKSIVLTKEGKASFYNITAITQIKGSTGVYKVFSNNKLGDEELTKLFGRDKKVEYVKLWGGDYGGATPQYRGNGMSLPFLLYDGAVNLQGHTSGGAIYYPSSMEQSSLACMELSAIGARAVAKLVARRLGFGSAEASTELRDEL
ncbi:hypothetical protein MPSEU_000892900 [Mayamaea pseudoterrestris]|nr:hypothetical protein MPSEU_000892900 [Mayamaea pseudoterrestris]